MIIDTMKITVWHGQMDVADSKLLPFKSEAAILKTSELAERVFRISCQPPIVDEIVS